MHELERLPDEENLKPAAGVPRDLLRGQIEAARALQEAIIRGVGDADCCVVLHHAGALMQVLEGVRVMIEEEPADPAFLRQLVAEGVEAAFQKLTVRAVKS